MKVLFLTIVRTNSLDDRGIYTDLLRKFRNEGHSVFTISPIERREGKSTFLKKENGASLLQVRTLNLQKSNLLEKGVGTLLLEFQYLAALKKYFSEEKFDLILYSTPPITFSKLISYVKKRDNAYAYLLLKDIFPQNAVDMHFMKNGGFIHKFFLKKEKLLYRLSDTIGCMSEANKSYVLEHHSELTEGRVEVNPNSIEPVNFGPSLNKRKLVRDKYELPQEAIIFIYGGNLGIPQGIDFLLKTIESCVDPLAFFLIVGSGREYNRIQKWFDKFKPKNAKLIKAIPKNEFDSVLAACDVGMIFLNPDFTIPNFPSRLLSYLEFKMPVISATDKNTDVGKVINDAGCGIGLESGDIWSMQQAISSLIKDKTVISLMGENARLLLENQFNVNRSYKLIVEKFNKVRV